jgi:hypothetical protein
MRHVLRSLATIVLAAAVPVLVFGAPRGGVTCTVAIIRLIEIIKNCDGPDLLDTPETCDVAGHPNCTYTVNYVDTEGQARSTTTTINERGNGEVGNCKTLQRKVCTSCPGGPCPGN